MNVERAQGVAAADAVAERLLQTIHVPVEDSDSDTLIRRRLGGRSWAHLFVFSPDRATLETLVQRITGECPGVTVTGCTTAGQIGRDGYADDISVIIGLPGAHFATRTVRIDDLEALDRQGLVGDLVRARTALTDAHPDKPNGFAFLLVDGLSMREDELAVTVAPSMGSWPVFGGSAGDGVRFEQTWLADGTKISTGAALLTFVCTDCETRVFSLNNLDPTEKRMIVTRADPARRIVKEINAEPAAREYARFVGKDPEQLDEFTFSAHPVVVRLGDSHHVRAIQRVNSEGELVFFAAIEEGMVLNVAEARDIAPHLDRELTKLKASREGAEIFACDCVLRKIEAEQTQATRALSDVLKKHQVVGFSTYGEQIGPLHVNQTMTGVMLVAPER